MLAPVERQSNKVTLIEKSNIQFLDYEALVNTKSKNPLEKFYQTTVCTIKTQKGGDKLVRRYFGKLQNEDDKEVQTFLDNERVDHMDSDLEVNLTDALTLYNGVWFPIAMLSSDAHSSVIGPIDWVRARIVEISLNDDDLKKLGENSANYRKYHITFAIDTNVSEVKGESYTSPTKADISSGTSFNITTYDSLLNKYIYENNKCSVWLQNWVKDIFVRLVEKRLKKRLPDFCSLRADEYDYDEIRNLTDVEKALLQKSDMAMYLSVLSFIEYYVPLKEIVLKSNSDNPIGVSLVLDVGNSRSCGLLDEDIQSLESADDNFATSYKLELRDLNAPENVYNDPFVSRVEFSKEGFCLDTRIAKANSDKSFIWPSIVRVGPEASKLAAHRDPTEGRTGTSSPKRYLWSIFSKPNDQDWLFNNYRYQLLDSEHKHGTVQKEDKSLSRLPSDSVSDSTMGAFINKDGNALFALERNEDVTGFSCKFSYKATMTFMLMEIFSQALTQINSYKQRSKSQDANRARFLKSIILTIPPSMPQQEREIFRSCAYEAIGILWKILGYDTNDKDKFYIRERTYSDEIKPVFPKVPEIHMDWNEAECCQVVYLYNETQKNFKGRCKEFISFLRFKNADGRSCDKLYDTQDGGHDYVSARIASVDIGGGTTDVVIRDYSFRKDGDDSSDTIIPSEIFSDGFKIAGDDIVKEIVKNTIIDAIKANIVKLGGDAKPIENLFVQNTNDAEANAKKALVLQQILIKVAYRIIFNLENIKNDIDDNRVTGTIADFLLGKEVNNGLSEKDLLQIEVPAPAGLPEDVIKNFVNESITKYLVGSEFSILDVELDVSLSKLNQDIIKGKFNICRALDPIAEIIDAYRVDVLLLSGRPSKISGIRKYFTQRLNLPTSRIIPMHSYRCKGWYPFANNASDGIGDPKTTAAVGALINLVKFTKPKRLTNFKYIVNSAMQNSQIRYFGRINKENLIPDANVYYEYKQENDEGENRSAGLENEVITANLMKGNKYYLAKNDTWVSRSEDESSFTIDYQVDLGYRQVDSETFPATCLYSLQIIDDYNRSPLMATAKSINKRELFELFHERDSKNEGPLNNDVFVQYKDEVFALEQKIKELSDFIASYESDSSVTSALDKLVAKERTGALSDLIFKYQNERNSALLDAKNEATAKVEGEKQGFASKLFGKSKREAEIETLTQELYTQKCIDLNMDLKLELSELVNKCEGEKTDLFGFVCDENIAVTRDKVQEGIDKANKLSSENYKLKVTISDAKVVGYVKYTNNAIDYKTFTEQAASISPSTSRAKESKYFDKEYDLRKEIFTTGAYEGRAQNVRPVLLCKLKEVKYENTSNDFNYTDVYELALQTVTANDRVFWIDSGFLDFGN